MRTKKANFSQPYWEYVLPLLSWVGLVPVLFSSSAEVLSPSVTGNVDFYLNAISYSSNGRLYITASLSISFLAWSINWLVNEHNLMLKRGYLPSLMGVLFGVVSILYTGFSLSYLAIGFLVLSVSQLFKSTREIRSYHFIFNSGFLFALGFLVDFRIWIAGVFLIISLLVIRSPRLRDLVVFILGLANVVALFAAYKFLALNEVVKFASMRHYMEIDSLMSAGAGLGLNIFYGVTVLIFISGMILISKYTLSMNNRTKERMRLFFLIAIGSFILSCLSTYYGKGLYMFSYLVPVMTLLFSISSLSVRNKWMLFLFRVLFIGLLALWSFTFLV